MSVQISDLNGKLPEGFVERVEVVGECWKWVGANQRGENPIFTIDKKNISAKKYAWRLANGKEILGPLVRRECCQIRLCVNPDHFYTPLPECPGLPVADGKLYAWIPGHLGYLVCDDGTVLSFRHYTTGGMPVFRETPIVLKTANGSNKDYQHVVLHNGGIETTVQVHQAILFAFVGPCPENMQVLHADDDPKNNRLDNLRYGTIAENSLDAKKNGRQAVGEKMGHLKDAQATEIRNRVAAGEKQSKLAEEFFVSTSTIWNVVRGKTYFHLLDGGEKNLQKVGLHRKMSHDDRAEMMRMRKEGMTQGEIAKHFRVSRSLIGNLIREAQ